MSAERRFISPRPFEAWLLSSSQHRGARADGRKNGRLPVARCAGSFALLVLYLRLAQVLFVGGGGFCQRPVEIRTRAPPRFFFTEERMTAGDDARARGRRPCRRNICASDGFIFRQENFPAWSKRLPSRPRIRTFIGLGASIPTILRAGLIYVRGSRHIQNYSTMAQRVAKNFLLNSDRTFDRKIREIKLNLQIESALFNGSFS